MRIHALILATLTACDGEATDSGSETTSGYDTCYGDPMIPSPFDLSTSLSSEQVESLKTSLGVTDASTITCEQACRWYVNHEQFSSLDSIDTCSHNIDASTQTGTLTCAGESTYYCEGRRPLGHVEEAAVEGLGGFLAHCAHLEAASVGAFEQLADQLVALGAPAALVARCRQAAAEERHHAALIGDLAQRHGGTVPASRQQPAPSDLESIALHNAVEGCVSETWAALAAGWKARRAGSGALRAAYAQVAVDEMRHAQLAWDLHAWLMGQLSPAAQARVVAAQQAAIAALPAQAAEQAAGMPAVLGMPAPADASAAAARFGRGLLAA